MEHTHRTQSQARHIRVQDEVSEALAAGRPIVALETAVATHGLPEPWNLDVLDDMTQAIRNEGAVPALCFAHDGELHVGAPVTLIREVLKSHRAEKASVRDLGSVLARGAVAGLTVSASIFAAHVAGIRVFATGGLGGVHAGTPATDISSDLFQLARTPIAVVCSGVKSILNIPHTLELLETLAVPVYGLGTDDFPSFYTRSTGLRVPSVSSAPEMAQIALTHWSLTLATAVVVANPIPEEHAFPIAEWDALVSDALRHAQEQDVRGQDVTPFLLAHIARLSSGRTVTANVALLLDNARQAARIAHHL